MTNIALHAVERKKVVSMEDYRATEFGAAVANGVYLNHAGVSPTPARVARAVQDAVGRMSIDPMAFFMQTAMPAIASVRGRLARLMGVPSEDIALMKNTGQGLALIADGLILEPGDNVVSAECEYPSVVYPWYAQSWRGIETRLVKTRPDGTISLEDVAALVDDRTRVITLSWVQFGTGYRADLQAWSDFAHAHKAIFVVDVIQGLGVLPLSAAEIGIDVVASGVHKWLLAPPGTGGLYIAPHVLERMRLVNMGAISVVDASQYDPLVFTPKPTAMRYEEGSPNVLGFIGLDAALSLLEEVGISEVAARVLALSGHAAEALDRKSYKVETPRSESERAGIVMFSHDTHENEAVLETLKQNGVTAAIRGGRLRFSPHFYNNREDIDRAVAALP